MLKRWCVCVACVDGMTHQYIIWEADENSDGVIDQQEFEMTFRRNMADTTGHEPRELFNIIQVRLCPTPPAGQEHVLASPGGLTLSWWWCYRTLSS